MHHRLGQRPGGGARRAGGALTPRPDISLTTNGIGLDRRAVALRDAGLDRINVSVDTLRPEVFRKLTHRERLADVLSGFSIG